MKEFTVVSLERFVLVNHLKHKIDILVLTVIFLSVCAGCVEDTLK